MPLDEITPDGWHLRERAALGLVAPGGIAGLVVLEKLRPCIFAGTKEDRVGMQRRFAGQRGDVQSPEYNISTLPAVIVRNFVRAIRRCDVHLDHDQLRTVLHVLYARLFNMLIRNGDFITVIQIRGESGQP